MDSKKLLKYINILIFNDKQIEEKSIDDIINTINSIFNNSRYKRMLNIADNNWLEISTDKTIESILSYFNSLKEIKVYN